MNSYLSLDISNDDTFFLKSSSSSIISLLGFGCTIGTAREKTNSDENKINGIIKSWFKKVRPLNRKIKIIGKCFMKGMLPQKGERSQWLIITI